MLRSMRHPRPRGRNESSRSPHGSSALIAGAPRQRAASPRPALVRTVYQRSPRAAATIAAHVDVPPESLPPPVLAPPPCCAGAGAGGGGAAPVVAVVAGVRHSGGDDREPRVERPPSVGGGLCTPPTGVGARMGWTCDVANGFPSRDPISAAVAAAPPQSATRAATHAHAHAHAHAPSRQATAAIVRSNHRAKTEGA
jgi:hypothetical protein